MIKRLLPLVIAILLPTGAMASKNTAGAQKFGTCIANSDFIFHLQNQRTVAFLPGFGLNQDKNVTEYTSKMLKSAIFRRDLSENLQHLFEKWLTAPDVASEATVLRDVERKAYDNLLRQLSDIQWNGTTVDGAQNVASFAMLNEDNCFDWLEKIMK